MNTAYFAIFMNGIGSTAPGPDSSLILVLGVLLLAGGWALRRVGTEESRLKN